jgi:pyruvate/2-oxoglutarate dehydrogenase complex dihydrolipoamide dehydrogenase (E3) component
MHIASPNAGEVIQGFALALKKGITYDVSVIIFVTAEVQ